MIILLVIITIIMILILIPDIGVHDCVLLCHNMAQAVGYSWTGSSLGSGKVLPPQRMARAGSPLGKSRALT